MPLTDDEVRALRNAETLTPAIWRIVAKDHGVPWSDYRPVPYWSRLEDFIATMERNAEP